MDWDDYRFFLALARHGTLTGAGNALGVNHATVLRRVSALEKRLGVRLFDKGPGGHAPTPAGERIRDGAERIEHEHLNLERHLLGQDLRLEGSIRVTSTADLLEVILGDVLVAFQHRYPGIQVEIATGQESLSLVRREADVAIRPTLEPPENAVGRRLAPLGVALYAAKSYLPDRPADWRAAGHAWIAPDDGLSRYPAWRWIRDKVPAEDIAMLANSVSATRALCASGAGIAALPCFMADGDPRLTRLSEVLPELGTELWLLTHADLRHTARIRAFLDFTADAVSHWRGWLAGSGEKPNPENLT